MEGDSLASGGSTTNRDRTFYGNGCPNFWKDEPPLYGGSDTACSTRIVQTTDNESQKNGTSYSYMAASSGSGGTGLTSDNTIVSDTFCPLGWQLPYGGTGGDYYDKSRSWKYIYSSTMYSESTLGRYPISLAPAGYFNFESGTAYIQEWYGDYSSSTSKAAALNYRIRVSRQTGQSLPADSTVGKSIGLAIRCVPKLAT